MNVNSGTKRSRTRSKLQRSNPLFHLLPTIPHDYLARRKLFRNISNVVMIVLFSLIIAGVIVYTSDPTSFSFLRH
jgi:hypothetical protein